MDSIFTERVGRTRAPDQVTERIRDAIVKGLLRPGERLPQEELAEQLGVSRMPIREALGRLEAEGLIVQQPYRGAVVAGLSADELREIYEIRVALETLAVRLGVAMMDEADLAGLRRVLQAMDEERESDLWLAHNTEFHSLLYASSRRELLLEHIQTLRNKSDRFLSLFAQKRDRTEQAQREHWAIFEACQARDAELACSLLQEHLESTVTSLSQTLADSDKAQADT